MKPEDVNPKNFIVTKILYNKDGFSIAEGIWVDDKSNRWAMRWNNSPTETGYPSVFKHPMWFQLPNNFKEILLEALLKSEI